MLTGDGYDSGFSVLFVCHANICRSPMAERLAAMLLARRFGGTGAAVSVSSAGTHAYAGDPICRHAARVLREHGADDTWFRSRPVDPALVSGADLVLTATREQRAYCVGLAPAVVRRAFTLRQFARLAAVAELGGARPVALPASRLRALVDATAMSRTRFQAVPLDREDLADPIGKPPQAYRDCGEEILASLSTVVDAVAGGSDASRPRPAEAEWASQPLVR